MFFFNLYARPYMDYRPDLLSMAISFANVFNSVVAALVLGRVEMSYVWIYPILSVNFALPLLAIFVGWRLNKMRKARRLAQVHDRYTAVTRPLRWRLNKMRKARRLAQVRDRYTAVTRPLHDRCVRVA